MSGTTLPRGPPPPPDPSDQEGEASLQRGYQKPAHAGPMDQLVEGDADVMGGEAGVALAGVPFRAVQAATMVGCISSVSRLATVAPRGPRLATTGCATGTSAPSTLQATVTAWAIWVCWLGATLLQVARQAMTGSAK